MTTQRRAWWVLLTFFVVCCLLTVGLPSTVFYVINTASYTPAMTIRLQAGIATAFCQGESDRDAKVVGLQGRPLDEDCTINVGSDSESIAELVYELPPPNSVQFVRMQLYAGTRLHIEQARIPRFRLTTSVPIFRFTVQRGRVEWQINAYPENQPIMSVASPHLTAETDQAGEFGLSIAADQSTLIARDGNIRANGVYVSAGKRITLNAPTATAEPIALSRNLVRNGNFQRAALPPDWEVRLATADNGISGTVEILNPIINPILDLHREGENLGWGRTGISQTLDVDLANAKELRARLVFDIQLQQIDVCGNQGSECPMMIDLRYLRKDGSVGQWVQGFYSQGEPLGGVLPDYMLSNRQSRHIYKPPRVTQSYVSENLLQSMPDAQKVISIALYAEGHAVHTQIKSIELTLD